jgi:hypothetical protein
VIRPNRAQCCQISISSLERSYLALRTSWSRGGKFVAYYRVSTDRQGRSGLGLDAQRAAVANYLNGGNWSIVAEFTEIESGRKSDRPELDRALSAARLHS